jgi:hypothetical protein
MPNAVSIEQALNRIEAQVAFARQQLGSIVSGRAAIDLLRSRLRAEPSVLLCGAGISIPAPANAPSFLDLRNAIVLGIARTLEARGIISGDEYEEVAEAIRRLARRADIRCIPEIVFSQARDTLGDRILLEFLQCLNDGVPNANHLAIRQLLSRREWKLTGVITTNFDEYVERALSGQPFSYRVRGSPTASGTGPPLLKVHGTLKEPASIAVTLEDVLCRLDDQAIADLREILANRTIIVIGYSGWDYDVFPLLLHAALGWNCRIIWVLWERSESLNEQIARLQLALGAKCVLVSAERSAALVEIGALWSAQVPQAASTGTRALEPLVARFARALSEATTVALIGALDRIGGPIALNEDLAAKLADRLVDELEAVDHPDEAVLQEVRWVAQRDEVAPRAIELGEKLSRKLGSAPWQRLFEHLADQLATDEELRELNSIEHDLREDFFPALQDPRRPWQSIEQGRQWLTVGLLIQKAEQLFSLDHVEEAETLATSLLQSTKFPGSGIAPEAWAASDGIREGKLHELLAQIAHMRGDRQAGAAHAASALAIYWREMDLFHTGGLLDWIGATFNDQPEIAGKAWTLGAGLHGVTGNRFYELGTLIQQIEHGFGSRAVYQRAAGLFAEIGEEIEEDERAEFDDVLRRFQRAFG